MTSKYFAAEEFERCIPPCRIEQMDAGFLAKLDEVRERAGVAMLLNCAYRSREWDLGKGRTGDSSHTKGLAVDIRTVSSMQRYRIIKAALEVGVQRIGIGATFIHLDDDRSKTQGVIWDYYPER